MINGYNGYEEKWYDDFFKISGWERKSNNLNSGTKDNVTKNKRDEKVVSSVDTCNFRVIFIGTGFGILQKNEKNNYILGATETK